MLDKALRLSVPGGLDSEESVYNAGDQGSIPGSESPLENGIKRYPLNILMMENPVDRGAWWATVSGVRV